MKRPVAKMPVARLGAGCGYFFTNLLASVDALGDGVLTTTPSTLGQYAYQNLRPLLASRLRSH